MTSLKRPSFEGFGRDAFAALAIPNYRRYISGQAVSLIGTWMQSVAQAWLVLQLTGSGTALGLLVALQTLPVLLLGPYGGVVADRVDKRKLMMSLQSIMGLLALVLGSLTVTHQVHLWEVFVLACLLGMNNAFENPARQSFVLEMVGPADLRNAVTLNTVLANAARAVGPAVAGVIIALGGLGICFLLNAASFAAVVFSLFTLDLSALQPSMPTRRSKGQLREGLTYVRRTPNLLAPLLMMALVGCLAYEFQVVLPVVAKETFHGGPQTYGFITAAMGIGAVIGGVYVAARGRTGLASLVNSAAIFALVLAGAAIAPNLWLEMVAIALVGAVSVGFLSKANTTLQLESAPSMRGRVISLWTVAFLGSTPIGGPIAGAVSEQFGGRAGLWLAAGACLLAAVIGALAVRRGAGRGADSAVVAQVQLGEADVTEAPLAEEPPAEIPLTSDPASAGPATRA
ncbi:MFS transporter [Jatrophihabitans sp. DSM 45814]